MKSLLFLGSCLSMLVGGVQQTPSRSHVVQEGSYEITYKFETNEVNSADDLVVGNIYHFTFDFQNAEVGNLFVCNSIYNIYGYENYVISSEKTNSNYIRVYKSSNTNILFVDGWGNSIFSLSNFNYNTLSCDILYKDIQFLDSWENYSISSYNVIEDVNSIVHNESVLGFVYDFVYNDILDIPNIDNFSFDVFGSHTTLRNYLTITICIVLAILIIWLLIWFVRYLFRLFAGLLYR